jgi:hypothetical protein
MLANGPLSQGWRRAQLLQSWLLFHDTQGSAFLQPWAEVQNAVGVRRTLEARRKVLPELNWFAPEFYKKSLTQDTRATA